MSETENNEVQGPQKKKSDMGLYIGYGIAIVVLSYAITYGMRIWEYNKNFKGVESALNIPVSEESWTAQSGLPVTDMGSFNMAVPAGDIQFMAILPQQGAVLVALQNAALQINQPTSAVIAADTIRKAQEENPENEVLKKMGVNDYQWHKDAAVIQKKGYFDFIGMDEVARTKYLAMINYKAAMPSNAEGIVLFDTDQVNGILHKGARPVEGKKETVAIVQLWDKNRDIIQDIKISCSYEKLDESIEYLKPILASINYQDKVIEEPLKQVNKCFAVISKYPWFKQLKLSIQQGPQPEGEAETAVQEQPKQ